MWCLFLLCLNLFSSHLRTDAMRLAADVTRLALEMLFVLTVVPKAQLALCEEVQLPSGEQQKGMRYSFKLTLILHSVFKHLHLSEKTRNEFIVSSSCSTAQRYTNHRTRFKLGVNSFAWRADIFICSCIFVHPNSDFLPLFVGMQERCRSGRVGGGWRGG